MKTNEVLFKKDLEKDYFYVFKNGDDYGVYLGIGFLQNDIDTFVMGYLGCITELTMTNMMDLFNKVDVMPKDTLCVREYTRFFVLFEKVSLKVPKDKVKMLVLNSVLKDSNISDFVKVI